MSSLAHGSAPGFDYRNSEFPPGALSHDISARSASTTAPSADLASAANSRSGDEHVPHAEDAGHDKHGMANQQYAAVTVADSEYHQNHQEFPMKAFDSNHADFSHAGDVDELLQQREPVNVTSNAANDLHPSAPALPDTGFANAGPTAEHLAGAAPQPQDLPDVGDAGGALPQPHGLPGVGDISGTLPHQPDLPGVGEIAGAMPQPHGTPGTDELARALPQPHDLPGMSGVGGALPQPQGVPGTGDIAAALPHQPDLPGAEGI